MDPTLPHALHAKGLARYKRGDLPGFIRHARPAADLGGDTEAIGMLAFVLTQVGDTDEARRYGDRALKSDPLAFLPWLGRSVADLFDGDARAALERLRNSRDRVAPGEPFAGWWVAQAAAYAGDDTLARVEFERLTAGDFGQWTEFGALFLAAMAGDPAEVGRRLEGSKIAAAARTDEYYPIFLANALALVGDFPAALGWLERAVDWGFSNHRFLRDHDRFLEPMRGREDFEALLARAADRQDALRL